MARKVKFPIKFDARKRMEAVIADLPSIPLMVENTKGEVIWKERTRIKVLKGSELLLRDKNMKVKDKPVIPTNNYKEIITDHVVQNHKVSIFAAYEQYGEPAIEMYCKQVWDYHYSLKTLPPEPKSIILT